MNFLVLWRVARLFKTEVKVVLITLSGLLLMPVFAVLVVAESGLAVVSDALASINPITHLVEVRNPDGAVVAQLNVTTTWPVSGMITEEFGVPHLPWQELHTGIDIANEWGRIGAPVTPFMAGRVIKTTDSTKGLGKHVIIDHGNNITSSYGHFSAITTTAGREVKPGDIIGLEGSTGASTGPHVHFEIRVYGVPVNPRIFVVGNPLPGVYR